MKKLLLFVVALVLSGNFSATDMQLKASEVKSIGNDREQNLVEGFEWEEMSPAWTVVDGDADDSQWMLSDADPHSGNKHLVVNYNSDGNNDWLISPKLTLQTAAQLSFWAKSEDSYYPESFNVLISETDTDFANFTNLISVIEVPDTYTETTFDLSAYDGKEVYIAVQCVSVDTWALLVDDFSVSNCTWDAPVDVAAPTFVSLTGNSVLTGDDLNLTLTVSDASAVPETIEATYDFIDSEETVTMNLVADKGQFVYTGTIESSAVAAESDITFHVADIVETPNVADIVKHLSIVAPVVVESLEDDLESIDNFVVDPAPYFFVDNDGFETYQFQTTSFENAGYVGSFIAFNPSATTPPLTVAGYAAHSGEKYLSCLTPAGSKTNDDWLISPQITIGENYVLEFWAKSLTAGTGLERFRVGVSTTGGNVEDFIIISNELNAAGKDYVEAPTEWTKYSFDLDSYGTEEYIYCAINCVSDDALMFMVDDISVKSVISSIEDVVTPATTELYQNYPNPFNPSTTINFFNSVSGDVKLSVFNVKGELVSTLVNGQMSASQHSVNFNASNLNSGVYYYTLETPTKSITKKMILIK